MADLIEQQENANRTAESAQNVPIDDLISRKAAIEAIEDLQDCYNGFSDTYDKACIIGVLEELPSAQPEWIPIKTRPMDEDEREYWSDIYGYDIEKEDAVTFECPMPEDEQEVWVCSKRGNVWVDVCVIDEGTGLEGNGDWSDIVAWMPYEKPEPYMMEQT